MVGSFRFVAKSAIDLAWREGRDDPNAIAGVIIELTDEGRDIVDEAVAALAAALVYAGPASAVTPQRGVDIQAAETVAAKFPMYVLRAFGGLLYLSGALIMAFDVTLSAPHGGIFVFFAVGGIGWFLVSLAAGTVVAALAVVGAKEFFRKGPSDAELDPEIVPAAA